MRFYELLNLYKSAIQLEYKERCKSRGQGGWDLDDGRQCAPKRKAKSEVGEGFRVVSAIAPLGAVGDHLKVKTRPVKRATQECDCRGKRAQRD